MFVKVRALRLQFDPDSGDAVGHYHSDKMLVVPAALHAPVVMIGEKFTNRITKLKTLEVVIRGEFWRSKNVAPCFCFCGHPPVIVMNLSLLAQ